MKESEIRPKDLTDEYLELSKRDANSFDRNDFQEIDCPGCGQRDSKPKFEKNDFHYHICNQCGSLYCSPRPTAAMFKKFYEESESSKYWSTVFFPAVAELRREKLFRRKAEQIHLLLKERGHFPENVCDVGADYGIFLEELQTVYPESNYFAIEPNPELASQCERRGFVTLRATAEEATEWSNRFDLVISQEVLEHVYSTVEFVQSLYQITGNGGYCLVTGLGYEGFDILTLQKNSNSVFPPHHINFLSLQGVETLFKRVGFTDIQVWTPGKLDVDIVVNNLDCPEFINVLRDRGGSATRDFKIFCKSIN